MQSNKLLRITNTESSRDEVDHAEVQRSVWVAREMREETNFIESDSNDSGTEYSYQHSEMNFTTNSPMTIEEESDSDDSDDPDFDEFDQIVTRGRSKSKGKQQSKRTNIKSKAKSSNASENVRPKRATRSSSMR